ncbi:superinfection immunity protein [Alkalimonas sp. MEB108]|uniref:Superinfection immunity protein n=1 Tax=Alkalimonas cellulosilytica TaxID=3058395 RepID=A0ABU7J285_9GAMM|nr:superinfection immunity protein [Alkalimonas sp. MEB108]MEE2000375.1 superinfection immunity protein [Alkalimonas sp. MEB108]
MFDTTEWAHTLQQSNLTFLIWFVPLFLAIYFVPTLLAVAFNRRHLGKIALANIPAGFSVIAWCALIGVAISGKLIESTRSKHHE